MKELMILWAILFTYGTFAREERPFLSLDEYTKKEVALIHYTEGLIKWRKKLNLLYEKMAANARRADGPLDSRQLETLRKLVREFNHKHKPRFEEILENGPNLIDGLNHIELTKEKSSYEYKVRFNALERSRRGRNRIAKAKALYAKVNFEDELGNAMWQHFRLQLAAKLVWLESYSLGFAPFFETKVLRRALIIDLEDSNQSFNLEGLWFEYMEKVVKTQALAKAKSFFDRGNHLKSGSTALFPVASMETHHEAIMDGLINKNQIIHELEQFAGGNNFFKSIIRNMNFMAKRRWDGYYSLGVAVLFEGSRVFGNTAGLFQFRHGHLFKWSEEKEKKITERLLPLDIIFEKTPFRLTDRFIPGYFGHAALWSGTEEELKELGVWRELSLSFQEKVRKGHRIIEALRPGVQFNTFRHFMDIDDLAVMRLRSCEREEEPLRNGEAICLTRELKKEYLLRAFSQIGKEYDFAFNVNTEETLICSELMYRTFLDIDFDTSLTVGQHNITPDQVAKEGISGQFNFILMIHKGNYVELRDDALTHYIAELISDKSTSKITL